MKHKKLYICICLLILYNFFHFAWKSNAEKRNFCIINRVVDDLIQQKACATHVKKRTHGDTKPLWKKHCAIVVYVEFKNKWMHSICLFDLFFLLLVCVRVCGRIYFPELLKWRRKRGRENEEHVREEHSECRRKWMPLKFISTVVAFPVVYLSTRENCMDVATVSLYTGKINRTHIRICACWNELPSLKNWKKKIN